MISRLSKYSFLQVLILLLYLHVVESNWILSVAQSSSVVNTNNTLGVLIRTSTSIPVNTLKLILPSSFQVHSSSCTVNNLTNPCTTTVNSTTLEKEVVFTFSFITNTQYFLGIGVQNPSYSDNFELRASNGLIAFATTGLISIDPKQVVCQIQGQSSTVGQKTIGLLSIQNDPIPLNSQISIKTNTLTVFRNIFNSGPSCTFRNTSLPCSLSTIFSQQILQIRSLPQVQSMGLSSLQVNSINNAPYNNTFSSLELQIQDSLGYPMQKCTFQQSKPTTLQPVKNVVVNGWSNGTGQESNISVFISTSFTTLSNQSILVIVPSIWRWTPLSPAVVQSTSTLGSVTRVVLTNLTQTSSSVLFNANVVNPGFLSLLNVEIYVLFNETNFRQEFKFSSEFWILQPYVTVISHILTNNRTFATTKGTYLNEKGNLTFTSQYFVDKVQTGGVSIQLKITLGKFVCSDMTSSLISNLSPLTVSSCADSQLQIFADSSLLAKAYWIVFPVLNHFSTQANIVSCTVSTRNGNYLITSGTFDQILRINWDKFGEKSSNFSGNKYEPQVVIPIDYSNQIGSIIHRIKLSELHGIEGEENYSFDPSPKFDFLKHNCNSISGPILMPDNFSNPNHPFVNNHRNIRVPFSLPNQHSESEQLHDRQMCVLLSQVILYHYSGIRNWNLQANDIFGNPSATASTLQMPQYQGIQGKFSFALLNKTIEQLSNITILVDPQLLYSQTINANQFPQVVISLSDSQFTNVITCPTANCTLLSQKKMSFKLASSFLGPLTVELKNSLLPTPISQQISLQIRIGNFLYQSHKKTYSLDPMSLEAVSSFSGLYGQMGIITVNLTTMPSRSDYTLLYSGQGAMLQSATCDNCNSSSLTIRGRVKYFQRSNLTIIAKSVINGTQITYAQFTTEIKYTCVAIQGCRICVNQTSSSNVTSLICQKCFDKSINNFNLLYEKKCIDACPVQTYADEVNCKNCPQNCYNCSDSSTCLECMPEYFVYTQTCVTSCPADYTKNSTHCLPRKIICPQNCINCPQDNVCQECEASYKLFKNICYSQCPSGYITSKFNSSSCQLFIPPEEAKYFPFAFVICSILFLIVLIIIRCFERRSLVMGNFISIMSVLEFGSFLMTLVYTLIQVQLNLYLQALLFVIILSKVLINMTFLLYFIKNIRNERQFSQWLEKYSENTTIYYIALILSTMISFNIIRIIYSRFMGLRIFFGRFSSGLIFKPINFFSIALTLIYSAPLIALCVYDIELQNGYKTKIFYSAIQTIVMQAIIFISWMIDWNRGKTDQFFDYQIYKVNNLHDQSNVNAIKMGQQNQVGGSTQQFLKSYRKMPQNAGSSLPEWQRIKSIPFSQGALSIDSEQKEKEQDGLLIQKDEEPQSNENVFKKRKSLFKIKILDQWRQLQKKLSNQNSKLKALKKPRQYISKSPDGRLAKKVKKQKKLKRNASLDKIEIRFLDTNRLEKLQKLRQYFYKVDDGGENVENNRSIISSVKEKEKSPKDIKNQKLVLQNKNHDFKPQATSKNDDVKIQINNYLEDPIEENTQKQIQPILQIHQEKSFKNDDDSIIIQRKNQKNNKVEESHDHDSRLLRQEQNLENILEEWTQNDDEKDQKFGINLEPCIKDQQFQKSPQKEPPRIQQQDLVQNSQPAQSNRYLKNSNFTKSTSAKPHLFSQKQSQTFQHKYNNLVRSKDVKISQTFKNLNKSHNETNSMDVSLPKAIFQSHQISEDHHRKASIQQQQVMNLTGPNLEEKEQEPRLVSKKKKKDKLVRLSKAQQLIQKRYLERIKSTDGKKSSSQSKRYRDLSNF